MTRTIVEHDGKRYEVVDLRPFKSGDIVMMEKPTVADIDGTSSWPILRELPADDPQPEPEVRWERTGEWRNLVEGEYYESKNGGPLQFLGGASSLDRHWILRRVEVAKRSEAPHPLPWKEERDNGCITDGNGKMFAYVREERDRAVIVAAANALGGAK